MLAQLDGAGAAQVFASAIRTSGHGAAECTARLGVLRALELEAPFPSDPRVVAAAAELARYAATATTDDPACLADAAAATLRVALWPWLTKTTQMSRIAHTRVEQPGQLEAGRSARALLAMWPAHPRRIQLLTAALSSDVQLVRLDAARDLLAAFVAQPLADREAHDALELAVEIARAEPRDVPVLHARCGP